MNNGGKRGRPPKGSLATATKRRRACNYKILPCEELKALCDQYFQECEDTGRKPTHPGLALFLGVTPRTLDRWAEAGEDGENEGADTIKKALARISDLLQQRTDSMAIFSLKQKCYGGYSEDGGKEKAGAVSVNISFGGTGADVAVKYGA